MNSITPVPGGLAALPPSLGTVLISDDEELLCSALSREARALGLNCITDTSGRDVVSLAKLHRPDVIVLDVNHRIDGRDLLAALKRDPETRHLKVIMLSGIYDQFVRHTCFDLGALDYELKPLDGRFMHKVARLARGE